MSTKPWLRVTVIAAAAATLALPLPGIAQSEPGEQISKVHDFQAEQGAKPDLDNRQGSIAPPASLSRSTSTATIRWNTLGTPAVITDSAPLAEGLGADPEQAARAYIKANENLFGLSPEAVDGLEKIAVNPIGDGHAVLLRQKFGDLPAGIDGQVVVGVKDGTIVHVTSTLSRSTEAPPAAGITGQQALEIAARDGGIDLATARTKQATPVAVPAPDGIHNAFQVVLIGGAESEAAGYTTHVDAVSGEIMTRENLVDHDYDSDRDRDHGHGHGNAPDNPSWEAFPANPPANYSSADTRKTWCYTSGARCDYVVGGDPGTGKAWDVDHVTGLPTNTSISNATRTVENRASGSSNSVGTRSNVITPSRTYAYPWTNKWYTAKCDPATFDQPGEADLEAAMANLHAMHNRMHDWSYRLGFTETAWNMQSDNGDRGGLGGDPERGNAQAGAPGSQRARQRQPDHRPRRGRADHQHVSLAADRGLVLRAVRGRRLRHVGDRT